MQNSSHASIKTTFTIQPQFWRILLENALSLVALYLPFQLIWLLLNQMYPTLGKPGPDPLFAVVLTLVWLALSFFVARYEVRYWRVALLVRDLDGESMQAILGPAKGMATVSYPLDDVDLPRTLADRKPGVRGWLKDMEIWSYSGASIKVRPRYFTHDQIEALLKVLSKEKKLENSL